MILCLKIILSFQIVGANSIVNVGSKIRLQLYEVPMHGCSSSEQPEVCNFSAHCVIIRVTA